jgi:tetratricopeptide (TPR) repeat protein
MSEAAKFKRQVRRKFFIFFLAYFLFIAIALYVFKNYLLPDTDRSSFIVTIGLVVVMLWFMLKIMFPKEKGSYLSDHYPAALDRLAVSFQKEADELIFRHLGVNNFQQMLQEESMNIDGSCQTWVDSKEVHANPDLRFYLLSKLANAYIKEDIYDRASACLEEALAIRPDNLLLNLRLAEVHEARGDGKEAIQAYQTALVQAGSVDIQSYLSRQIERVKTQGPRKATPMPGLRYVTY